MESTQVEWTLPCEIHQIEPGIIFGLTHRDGAICHAVDQYPTPPFHNLYHRNPVIPPPTIMSSAAISPSSQNGKIHHESRDTNDGASNPSGECVDDNDVQDADNSRNVEGKSMEVPVTILNEPLYVNPKQYHRILRRREIRTQLRNKLIRENRMQPWYKIGEGKKQIRFKSRHEQAKRRLRGPRGQFLSNQKHNDK